ncbi:MAG: glycosyltransferase [Acidimicrobiia bacterium]|nr:glycosyltransferase [Acidimicrobiia bacterium]
MLSQRGASGGPADQLAYSAWSEAENVLVEVGGARLGLLDVHRHHPRVKLRRVAGRGLRRIAGSHRVLPARSDGLLEPLDVRPGEADHLILMAHGAWEVPLVERLGRLRRSAKTISVWMPEVWPSELDDRLAYEGYDMVDHVFVGIREVVDRFAELVPNADVHCLPPAVDVVTFGGPDPEPNRNIAVLGIGRREPTQHRRILEWAAANQELYLYDTLDGKAVSWRQHRDAVANWYRQSRMAVCNYGKHDRPQEIGGLRIVPGRLFEGLAAGSILIGMPPDEENQRQLVGEVVVESTETTELETLLDKYNDPESGRRMRLRNASLAARRHDWAHRWRDVFQILDLPQPAGLDERLDLLTCRADEIDNRLG